MYTIHDRVSYSRIDNNRRIGVESIINCMQDCALFHSEDIGRSAATLAKEHRAWLVSAWHVFFVRRPVMGEYFDVHTWAYKFSGLFGHRNFLMETPEHEVLAYADSRWFFFDSENMKPTRVAKEEIEGYGTEPAYDMDYGTSRKVAVPEGLEFIDTIRVNPSLLDTNNHMNNGQYVRFAVGYLPMNFDTAEFRAEYRNAAHYGDDMRVLTGVSEGKTYVIFADESDEPYFISEFTPK
ncbi:MAG TPA: acyl-[acyl-carrier-protein] thioesterase [Lachnospiraceae bacterium]|nr:acyl-[acyl-carrier-protein] thioesterase [Eubacterium sp.]HAK57434.1 acyl-[acyl-carrier-protein] thioesterase [Lachnospiraceae bacterium]